MNWIMTFCLVQYTGRFTLIQRTTTLKKAHYFLCLVGSRGKRRLSLRKQGGYLLGDLARLGVDVVLRNLGHLLAAHQLGLFNSIPNTVGPHSAPNDRMRLSLGPVRPGLRGDFPELIRMRVLLPVRNPNLALLKSLFERLLSMVLGELRCIVDDGLRSVCAFLLATPKDGTVCWRLEFGLDLDSCRKGLA